MFGSFAERSAPHIAEHADVSPWTRLQELQAEKETLGLYLTGHPVELQADDLARFTSCTLDEVASRAPEEGKGSRRVVALTLAGLVHAVRRRGNRGGWVTLEDHRGRQDISLFDDTWTLYADLLSREEIIVAEVGVSIGFGGGHQVRVQKLMTLSDAKSRFARGVRVSLKGPDAEICSRLKFVFAPYRNGSDRVWLDYSNARARASMELGAEWGVNACEELVAALGELENVSEAKLVY
jgi:DNA polymerase-3 subunit alpha